jgi:hypothetical protein
MQYDFSTVHENGDGTYTVYPEPGETMGLPRTYRKATRADVRPGDFVELDGQRFEVTQTEHGRGPDDPHGIVRMVLEAR